MNLGIERFLILGCVAVLILELPEILTDLRLGDGFPGVTAPAALVAEVAEPSTSTLELVLEPESDVLAKLVAHEPVWLPATPGL